MWQMSSSSRVGSSKSVSSEMRGFSQSTTAYKKRINVEYLCWQVIVYLGCGGVGEQQTPVNVATVTKIGIISFLHTILVTYAPRSMIIITLPVWTEKAPSAQALVCHLGA